MTRRVLPALLVGLFLFTMTNAEAIHWYRSPGFDGKCSEADGELTDPDAGTPTATTEVRMLHNAFEDTSSGDSTTHVKVGEAVKWTWNSAHCHSAEVLTGTEFNSGFHWPKTPPDFPPVAAVPGFFEYPLYDETPTLSYVHIFNAVGTFAYKCIHHASIGMVGTVEVTA